MLPKGTPLRRTEATTQQLRHFAAFVKGICLRPKMYTGSDSFMIVCIFLYGYSAGLALGNGKTGAHIPYEFLEEFEGWLQKKHDLGSVAPLENAIKKISLHKKNDAYLACLSEEFNLWRDTKLSALELLAEAAE